MLCLLLPCRLAARPRLTDQGSVSPPASVLLLTDETQQAALDQTLLALRSHLSDVAVLLLVRHVEQMPPDLTGQVEQARGLVVPGMQAVIWLDLVEGKLTFYQVSQDRVLLRRVEGQGPAGHLEALAIMARTAISATLEGVPVGTPAPRFRLAPRRAEGAGPGPAPVPPPRRPSGQAPSSGLARVLLGLDLELAYTLTGHAEQAGTVHGLTLALAGHLPRGLSLLLQMQVQQELFTSSERLLAWHQHHPLGLGLRWQRDLGRFFVGLSLGLVMDYVAHQVQPLHGSVRADPDQDDVIWLVSPTLLAGRNLLGKLSAFAAAGCLVPLYNPRYTLAGAGPEGQEQVLLAPWPVQPTLLVGLSLSLL